MNPVRKRKLMIVLFILFVLSLSSGLVLYALRQNISLFYSPSQIARHEAPLNHAIRVGGMVVKGSLVRGKEPLSVQFKITDFNETLHMTYHGILPDLFREGQGIVAQGQLLDNGHFQATTVLAKHDENYMPPEVKSILTPPSP